MNENKQPSKSQVNELFRKGHSVDELETYIPRYMPELNLALTERGLKPQMLKVWLQTYRDDFGLYNYIQSVRRSKILAFADDRILLYDPANKTSEDTSDKLLRRAFHRQYDISQHVVKAEEIYDPFNPEKLFIKDEKTYFNSYVPPAWLSKNPPIEATAIELPQLYKLFFEHLFANDTSSIDYALDWMANSLQGRNVVYLATIGKQGIGKGTFGQILSGLHGVQNYTEINFKSISKQFNSYLENKRLIYFDEFSGKDNEKMDVLKSFANDRIEVERKHRNAQVVQNFASIYLSSNHMDCLRLESDNRRFSIIDLTDKPIRKVLTESERLQLFEPENIAQLGRFLLQRKVDTTAMASPHKSERTKLVNLESLADWEDYFLTEYCQENAGRDILIGEIADALTQHCGAKIRFGKKAFRGLERRFPNFFKEKRIPEQNKSRLGYHIYPLSEQPRHLLEDINVEEIV